MQTAANPDLIVRGRVVWRGLPWWRNWLLAPLVPHLPEDPRQLRLPFSPDLQIIDGGLSGAYEVEIPYQLLLPLRMRFTMILGGRSKAWREVRPGEWRLIPGVG